ncbi:MAG: aminotransferase class I/II-fold pyridoxal phosphate-dependent enzyme [Deltaproteobacteria bacterium]|nr:aminotransferase class I/II-fold pyridoxal phosphate-dependent enzyme [Deltaproteobacteria bacterium]
MAGSELIGKEEKKEVMDILETGIFMRYGFDEERKGVFKVKEFEKAFVDYLGIGHALGVTSGSAALKVALTALDVGPGDEVLVPAFDFIATYEAVLEVGAIPIMTDIDESLNLDPEDIEAKITPATKCVIPVHMCGAAAQIDKIIEIAKKHNLVVLEDNAQACGGSYRGKKLGTFGDMAILSFDYYKTMTTGEGGMVLTNSKALKDALGAVPGIGFRKLFDPDGDTATFLGFNLPDEATAKRFQNLLADRGVGTIYYRDNTWHYAPRWEHLIARATANSKQFPFTNPMYKGTVRYSVEDIPHAEEIMSRTLFMIIPVKMSEEARAKITDAIAEAAKEL